MEQERWSVLIVEDDRRLAALTREYLRGNGFAASVENDGERAVERIIRERPDLVVLDLMLPGLDGIAVCRQVREHYAGPILMLTARADDEDQVLGLESGADDYVCKPVRPRVLLARIRALLRRLEGSEQPCLQFGPLVVDSRLREATLDGRAIELTGAEFDLLWLLVSNAGRILSREEIFAQLRGIEYDGQDRSIDVRISRIRPKIGDDPDHPRLIKTVRSKGYLFVGAAAGTPVNSIFLRIYGGMLAVLVLVGLLGAFSLHWLNEVRTDRYREAMAGGTFRLMAQAMQDMTAVQRRQAASDWGRMLGAALRVRTFDDARLDPGMESRLLRGRLLVEQQRPGPFTLYSLVSAEDRLLLAGELAQIGEQMVRVTSRLLIAELIRFPEDEQPARLAALMGELQFGFDIRLIAPGGGGVSQEQRLRLAEGEALVRLDGPGEALRLLDAVPGSSWVLQVGPLYRMSRYPAQLLFLIAALGLTLIGLTLYLLVRPLERRLLELEQAASDIASGHLEVRVPDSGSDSVGRLAAAFNHMAARLQRLLAIQREMVSAVAHELRTPVARLRFGLEMSAEAPSDESRCRYLQSMDADLEELDQLLDEMLVYIRLEKGAPSLSFTPVALDVLIAQVIAELAPLRPGVELLCGTCDGEAVIDAEPRYLRRALLNLVSNAMRHAESRVTVRFFHDGARVGLEVEDDGPGVPEGDQEKIFTPFLRLDDSRTRDSGGHGLGLSIVRRVIYWHGGRVQVGRATLGGARFTLLWPARHEQGETHSARRT